MVSGDHCLFIFEKRHCELNWREMCRSILLFDDVSGCLVLDCPDFSRIFFWFQYLGTKGAKSWGLSMKYVNLCLAFLLSVVFWTFIVVGSLSVQTSVLPTWDDSTVFGWSKGGLMGPSCFAHRLPTSSAVFDPKFISLQEYLLYYFWSFLWVLQNKWVASRKPLWLS